MAGDILPVSQVYPPKRRLWQLPHWGSRTRRAAVAILAVLLLIYFTFSTLRRDAGYILRPLWDSPDAPFTIIPHYPKPGNDTAAWCHLHGWTKSSTRPMVVDAFQINTELNLLEIRMREYAPYVSLYVIVESNKTQAGVPKPLHFAANRARFDALAASYGARIAYAQVTDLEIVPAGSSVNEYKQRVKIGDVIEEERLAGNIPPGSLIIQADPDEIISRDTLDLLTSCTGLPSALHLSVRNYRYSFEFPLRDQGYWRPKVVTVGDSRVGYSHSRGGDMMLAGSGWHCTFCFPTLDDIRAKMTGYIHNDRVTSSSLLKEKNLRARVCRGEDPFNMWPEVFTFKDLVAQSGPVRPDHSFVNLPIALQDDPKRWSYLLGDGCRRPNSN